MSTEQISTSNSTLAFRNFVNTCRSPATRSVYVKALHYFMDYLKIDRHQYQKLLEKDPKLIQMDICDFILYLKKDRSSAAISVYVGAVNKFYAMNDVNLNWKKIRSFMGEHEKVAEDRPYIHSEIQTLLQNTSRRNRAIILCMASSGTRVGAIPFVRIKDLEPIDKYNIYKITYYPHSKKSRYLSFCTPECRKAIDDYLEYRKRWGEKLIEDSPLFRSDYNAEKVTNPKQITISTIEDFMNLLLLRCGLRKPSIEGKKQRLDIMMTHGLRKFFETNAFKAGMEHMYLRRLMGQKSGLEDSYLKISVEELLEGDSRHVGYIGVIDQLTMEESNKLRREVQTLKQEVTRFDKMQKQIEELNRKLGLA